MSDNIESKYTQAGKWLDLILKFLFTTLFRRQYAPQIFVLLVDTVICAVSYLLVITFGHNPTVFEVGSQWSVPIKTTLFTLVYLVVNLLVQNYKYTIRLPIIEDMYRTARLVIYSSVVLIAFALVVQWFDGTRYFSLWNLLISGVMSFTIMTFVRLITKHLYSIHVNRIGDSVPVILLGCDATSISLATMLRGEQPRRYNPMAVICTGKNTKDGTINGFPVFRYDGVRVGDIMQMFECNTILVPDNMLDFAKINFAELFLKNDVKLMIINHVTEFIDQEDVKPSAHVERIKLDDLLGRDQIFVDVDKIRDYFNGLVILITGAAGSIGSELTRQIITLGAGHVVLVDQAETPMHSLMLEIASRFPQAMAEIVIADITNEKAMERLFGKYKPDIVLHAAAYKHVPMMEFNPIEAVINNVIGTKILADLAVKHGVGKFVMVSTDKAVNPTNIMGATKRAAEIYVQSLFFNQTSDSPTQFITTRFGNVLGSNGSVIPLFKRQIETGGPVTITHNDIIRYFMTISEACSLVLEASCLGHGGEIFIFDMGEPVKIRDLAEKMISLAGLTVDKDIKIVEVGLRPGEKLFEELLYDKENTIPTSNKKIMLTNVVKYDFDYVNDLIGQLVTLINGGDETGVVRTVKRIVPEFKSENSQWKQLDG